MGRPASLSSPDAASTRRRALRFIILLGVVSLFGDMTYEGARSVTGPLLAVLGASATVVGIVAGLVELLGYALRLASGYLTDRTGRYWAITLMGYAVNLFAVPLLALAGSWKVAAALMIAERAGRAVRTPARDVMLSHAGSRTGVGWGFGLHEAMDQTGAILGPLNVSAVLSLTGDYRAGFGVLAIPAALSISVLVVARFTYPRPRDLEPEGHGDLSPDSTLPRVYWAYLAAVACTAAGYPDFPLIAFHFEKAAVVEAAWIPVLYSVAIAADAIAVLVLGRLFDRVGVDTMILATMASALAAPFAFLGGPAAAIVAMVLWGIRMGAQESVMRAAIAKLAPAERRGSAYGMVNAAYGVAWFAGSALLGVLYDVSIPALVATSVVLQLAALPIPWRVRRSTGTFGP